jgi:hypothetical protein
MVSKVSEITLRSNTPILAFPLPVSDQRGMLRGNNGISLTLLTTLTDEPGQPHLQQAKKPGWIWLLEGHPIRAGRLAGRFGVFATPFWKQPTIGCHHLGTTMITTLDWTRGLKTERR